MKSFKILAPVILVLFSVILFNCAVVNARKSYEEYQVLAISVDDAEKFIPLTQLWGEKVDFWDGVRIANEITRVMVHKDDLDEFGKYLTENGFQHEIIIENVETIVENQRQKRLQMKSIRKRTAHPRDFEMNYFWDYDEIMEYVDSVGQEYSDIVTIDRLIDSTEGRRIVALEITAPGDSEGRAVILIDSTIHAREWAAPMTMMYLIRELTENFLEYEDTLELVKFIIVPLVNPDGFQYTFDEDRFWRKTRRINEGSTCVGVDGNRNYDHKWEEGTFDPCSIIYAGTAPFSEVETQNIQNLVFANAPKITMYFSTHTYGNLLLYPFSSTTSQLPENYQEQEQVGRIFTRAVEQRFGTTYRVGNGANLLAIASGTSKDWAYPRVRISYTLELPGGGSSGFDIEFERIENIGLETTDGFLEMADYVSENFDYFSEHFNAYRE